MLERPVDHVEHSYRRGFADAADRESVSDRLDADPQIRRQDAELFHDRADPFCVAYRQGDDDVINSLFLLGKLDEIIDGAPYGVVADRGGQARQAIVEDAGDDAIFRISAELSELSDDKFRFFAFAGANDGDGPHEATGPMPSLNEVIENDPDQAKRR